MQMPEELRGVHTNLHHQTQENGWYIYFSPYRVVEDPDKMDQSQWEKLSPTEQERVVKMLVIASVTPVDVGNSRTLITIEGIGHLDHDGDIYVEWDAPEASDADA